MDEPRNDNLPPRPFDEPQLSVEVLRNLRLNVFFPVTIALQGVAAATAANYGNFFVADRAFEVVGISEVHRTAGSDAGAVTLNIEKCTSGVAPDSGVTLLATAFDLKGTADTPQHGTLTATRSNLLLNRGDRLVLKDSGTLTAVADVAVTLILRQR